MNVTFEKSILRWAKLERRGGGQSHSRAMKLSPLMREFPVFLIFFHLIFNSKRTEEGVPST